MNAKEYYYYLHQAQKKQEDTLAHYGTKGQKWGIRNWQNYDGTFNQAGKERYFGTKNQRVFDGKESPDYTTEKGMDPLAAGLIALLAPYAVVGVAAGVSTAAGAVHDGRVSKRIRKYEENLLTEEVDKKTGLRIKNDPDSSYKSEAKAMANDMLKVNMEYDYVGISQRNWTRRDGCTNNCMLCTTAMDLRRRGYDVRAGKVEHGFNENELKKWYKNPKIKYNTWSDMEKFLKNEPEGSYGNFMVTWKNAYGAGHSMFYRIENGQPKIYCAQSDKVFTMKDLAGRVEKFNEKSTCVARTDNLEPNYDYLKKNKLIRYEPEYLDTDN